MRCNVFYSDLCNVESCSPMIRMLVNICRAVGARVSCSLERPHSRRTLINQAVNVCVKFFPWNDETTPDFASGEFLRPNRFTDCPDCTRAIDSRLLNREETSGYCLGWITAESCLLDWHIMPSKQCGSFLASTHVPASACRLAPHGAPPQLCEVLVRNKSLRT